MKPSDIDIDEGITLALKALEKGNANEGQQRMALDWIVRVASGYYETSYHSEDPGGRKTAHAEGRRLVGGAIVTALNIRLGGNHVKK